jgi:GNAT superfamily N-acetyltransferase
MSEVEIRLARAEDVARLPEIERRASTIFSPEDLPPAIARETASLETYSLAQHERRLIVACDSESGVIGFAHAIVLDGGAHLEEVDVDPEFARRGIGRRLVEGICGWAAEGGFDSITLSTFSNVAWNAPFYAGLGWRVLPQASLSEALHGLRENEQRAGLDMGRRVIMRRPIRAADRALGPGPI